MVLMDESKNNVNKIFLIMVDEGKDAIGVVMEVKE